MIVETVFMTIVLAGLLLFTAGIIGYWHGHAKGKAAGLEHTATAHLTRVTQSMLEMQRQSDRREAFRSIDPTITSEDPPVARVADEPRAVPSKPEPPKREYVPVPEKRQTGSFPIGGNYIDQDFASFDVSRSSMG